MRGSCCRIDVAFVATTLGGTALFLLGNLTFKAVLWGRWPLSHLVGLGLLVVAAFVAPAMSTLALATVAMAVLVVVAAWETLSLRGLVGVPEAAERH